MGKKEIERKQSFQGGRGGDESGRGGVSITGVKGSSMEVKIPVNEVDSNSPKFKEGVTSKGAKIDEEDKG